MTQPPEDRRPDQPPDEGGVGYAAIPDDAAPAAAEPPPAPPPPAGEWQTAAQPPPAPASGWVMPAEAAAVTTQEGDVIAGPGARLVAWLIDYTLAGIVPAMIGLALIDWSGFFERLFDALAQDPTGRSIDPRAFVVPITLDFVLANLIAVGVLYLYFVFFWTSRWRATPGMIGLRMRVVDAMTGGELSLVQATKRWLAFGYWLPLVGLLPGLQNSASLIQTGLWIILFFTVVTNDRRQGIQDRWAGSLVVRSSTSGSGATIVGCLVWGVMLILFAFLISTLILAPAMPAFQEYLDSLRDATP